MTSGRSAARSHLLPKPSTPPPSHARPLSTGAVGYFIAEYFIHKYIFHMPTSKTNRVANIFHLLLHGFHHKFPFDPWRLVAPPLVVLAIGPPLLLITIAMARLVGGHMGHVAVSCAGLIVGYGAYDLMHFATHNAPNWPWLERWRKYHMLHHFSGEENRFGVSNAFFDVLFGTYKDLDEPHAKDE